MAWGYRLLEAAGKKRGFLISGGEVDTERMAKILLDEFRGGKLGSFTLELPEEDVYKRQTLFCMTITSMGILWCCARRASWPSPLSSG